MSPMDMDEMMKKDPGMPMPGDDESDEASALGKALDQIRDLLDQIETKQVMEGMKKPGEDTTEDGGVTPPMPGGVC